MVILLLDTSYPARALRLRFATLRANGDGATSNWIPAFAGMTSMKGTRLQHDVIQMECVANATLKRTLHCIGKLDDHPTPPEPRMIFRYAVFVAACAALFVASPHASARMNEPIYLNGVHAT